jgi:hypothetical protein
MLKIEANVLKYMYIYRIIVFVIINVIYILYSIEFGDVCLCDDTNPENNP